MAQAVKNSTAMQEMQEAWAQSVGQEDPLEKEMATHSSILAWKNLMDILTWKVTLLRVTELDMTECLSTEEYSDFLILMLALISCVFHRMCSFDFSNLKSQICLQ